MFLVNVGQAPNERQREGLWKFVYEGFKFGNPSVIILALNESENLYPKHLALKTQSQVAWPDLQR